MSKNETIAVVAICAAAVMFTHAMWKWGGEKSALQAACRTSVHQGYNERGFKSGRDVKRDNPELCREVLIKQGHIRGK